MMHARALVINNNQIYLKAQPCVGIKSYIWVMRCDPTWGSEDPTWGSETPDDDTRISV